MDNLADDSYEDRQRYLGDFRSPYHKTVEMILRERMHQQRKIEDARQEITLPIPLSVSERSNLERIFSWKLKVKDYGIRSKLPPYVAAVVYLMELRNCIIRGNDGEESVYLDGDLPLCLTKGLSYGHVCRTHASARLEAEYMIQDSHLTHMAARAGNFTSATAAKLVESMQSGATDRVCNDAANCVRMADTVYINHVSTPVSLEQAVLTAKAHSASVVRGCCFFQPEMLIETSGELVAFPGKYVIDRHEDVISFIPRSDPTLGFSHPYSSLVSFFVNNQYVDSSGSWLLEKHLSGDGIYHYILRRQDIKTEFSDELTTNLYTEDMTRFTYFEYNSYYDDETGIIGQYPKTVRPGCLTSVYEKIMPILMCIDPKRLTFDEVFSLLKNYNNMVFAGGDTVRKPERVWYSSLKRVAVPLLAIATVRRAESSESLKHLLENVKIRVGLQSLGSLALMWAGAQKAVAKIAKLSIFNLDAGDIAETLGVNSAADSLNIKIYQGKEYITISTMSGQVSTAGQRVEAWLPGKPTKRFDILARARRALYEAGVSVSNSVSSISSGSRDGGVNLRSNSLACSDDEPTPRQAEFIIPVAEREVDVTPVIHELGAGRKELLEKLCAQHDARSLVRPPRLVRTYEGPVRSDVEVTPLLETDPAIIAQADYDQIYPGLSEQDAEIKPVLSMQFDWNKNVQMVAKINDSKRLLPEPKWIQRSKLRTGASGRLPRNQTALMTSVFKRNVGIPANRGYVKLEETVSAVVDKLIKVCFVDDWKSILRRELESGLWLSTINDLEEYVPKVPTNQLKKMLNEIISGSDEDLVNWLLMLKSTGKPPMDPGADCKVPLAQTIMHSNQKSTNAKYSSMQTRVYHVVRSMLRPNISLNSRDSPEEHEVWFNSCEGIRATAKQIHAYEGDISNYDRSFEHVLQLVEATFYKRMGIDQDTLDKWSETHGVKTATSAMYGLMFFIFGQGISGIWKTLFRNGLCCLAVVIYSFDLNPEDIITLDVVGDDFLLESNKVLNITNAIDKFSLTFNLSAKLYGTSVLYMCSKYWIRVNNWWYYVQDPMRKIESLARAVDVSTLVETPTHERWISLRNDVRHYDNALVMEFLAEAVQLRMGYPIRPMGIIRCIATLAYSEKEFDSFYLPKEILGY